MKSKRLVRKCPKCGLLIHHNSKHSFHLAVLYEKTCHSCSNKGRGLWRVVQNTGKRLFVRKCEKCGKDRIHTNPIYTKICRSCKKLEFKEKISAHFSPELVEYYGGSKYWKVTCPTCKKASRIFQKHELIELSQKHKTWICRECKKETAS